MVTPGEIEERIFRRIRDEKNIAALAAVSAVRAALGDEFFTAKAQAPVPAFATANENLGTVDEHGYDLKR